jgi:fatty-acyl-CoA synthase
MVLVTVNPAYQHSELKYVLGQSRAVGVFYQTSFRGNPMSASVAAVAGELPELRECICLDDFSTFVAQGNTDAELPNVDPHDPVMIQYTSGTTGFPKGAHLHHYGVTNNSRLMTLRRGGANGTVDISSMLLFLHRWLRCRRAWYYADSGHPGVAAGIRSQPISRSHRVGTH